MFRFSSFRALSVVTVLLLLHLPFLLADPDPTVTFMSRGPWTDEGLNTVQVRNFVNHGYLNMAECDNLIKTPFFGFVLVPFYALLGTHIWVGRVVVLGAVLLVLFVMLAYRPSRSFAMAFAVLGLLQFHIFHYAHYSMAEMMGVSFILLGIFLMRLAYELDSRKWLLLSGAAFGISFLCKVTFAYALLLPFIAVWLNFLSQRLRGRGSLRELVMDTVPLAGVAGFFATTFYLRWYLVHKDVFDLVRADQGNNRFDLSTAFDRAAYNWDNFINVAGMAPFFMLLVVALWAIVRVTDRGRGDRIMLFALMAWLLLESHRFLLVNPPTRYLVPLFAAVMALTAFGITQWKNTDSFRVVAIMLMIGLGVYNLSNYHDSLGRRTFVMKEVSDRLTALDLRNDTVLGVWATGLAASSQARTLPVWNGFMNYKDPLHTFRPRLVISEHDEADNSQAYRSQGIDLRAASDSVSSYQIWRYKVNLYWISPTATLYGDDAVSR
jgi:hypothetical protein